MGKPLKDHMVLLFSVNNLTVYDLEGSKSRIENNNYISDYYTKNIKGTSVDLNPRPWMYWRGYGYIHQLDHIDLKELELSKIYSQGLDIYLNELCTFYQTHQHPQLPFALDTNQTYIQREYSHCVFDFNNSNKLRSHDLDSIEKFAARYNITNITVHTCHKGSESYLKEQYPTLNFTSYNTCLQSLVLYINRLYTTIGDKEINKRFITPLWRYNGLRHMLAAIMVNKDSYLSWYYKGSLDILQNNLWFDLEQLDTDLCERIVLGVDQLDKVYSIDPVAPDFLTLLNGKCDLWKYPEGYDGYYIENTLEDYYRQSFCAVVSESIYAQPFPTISEKTMIAMKCLTPFVVLGAPGTLQYLKELGFKTFDQWWDESYDLEQNHYKRFQKIVATIDYIETLDIEYTLENMQDALIHNMKLVSKLETFQQ